MADPAAFDLYQKKLTQAIQEAEATVQTWEKYDQDYVTLRDFLAKLPETTKKDIMVPFGSLAFMPGQLVHTNEVMVLLGDTWFAERSAMQAVEIVDRRREYTKEKLVSLQKHLEDLKLREGLSTDLRLEKSMVDADGDEVNEEGLKFVEIREEYHEDEREEDRTERAPATQTGEVEEQQKPQIDPSKLGDFERRLFEKIRKLEEEEEEGQADEDTEPDDSEDGDREAAAIEEDSEDEMRFEQADDDDDDYNDESPVTPPAKSVLRKSKGGKGKRKSVSFAPGTTPPSTTGVIRSPADIYDQMAARSGVGPADPHKPAQRNAHKVGTTQDIVKSAVVENEDIEDENESDVEDYMFGRELAEEYQRRRHQFIAAQTAAPLSPEEEHALEEERQAQKEQKISRFRAARMAVRGAVEFPQEAIRGAMETRKPVTDVVENTAPRFTPNIPAATERRERRRSSPQPQEGAAPVEELAPKPKETVTSEPPKRVSRFKAALQGGGNISKDTQENEDEDEMAVDTTPSRPRLSTPPKVVPAARPSDEKPMAAPSTEAGPAMQEDKSSQAPRKVSRFKAARTGGAGGSSAM